MMYQSISLLISCPFTQVNSEYVHTLKKRFTGTRTYRWLDLAEVDIHNEVFNNSIQRASQ